MTFGETIKMKREALGLALSAAAELIEGIDGPRLSKLERDKHEPRRATVRKITEAYEKAAGDLSFPKGSK